MSSTNATAELVLQIKAFDLPKPEYEVRFHPTRKWRFDIAWLAPRCVAVEIQGGVYVAGRHTRGAGTEKDYEKFNEALLLGWKVVLLTPGQVQSGYGISVLRKLLA